MKKRGILTALFIIGFLSSVSATHLSGGEQRSQVIEWNLQLREYVDILETRPLTQEELSNAISIAQQRKTEMIEIIKTNQQYFSELILMDRIRNSLPQQVQEYLETPITKEGVITLIAIDFFEGEQDNFYTFQTEGIRYNLYFYSNPTTLIQTDDLIKISGWGFLYEKDIFVEELELIAFNKGGGGDIVNDAIGNEKFAVLIINFEDLQLGISRETMDSTFEEVINYYSKESYGKLNVEFDILGPYTLGKEELYKGRCSREGFLQTIRIEEESNKVAGGDLEGYTRFIYVFPRENYCDIAGWGTIGGNPSIASIIGFTKGTIAHELGHNFGAGHANSLNCETNPPGGIKSDLASCIPVEYGDSSEMMGFGSRSMQNFNSIHKEIFGWLDNIDVATSSGRYFLAPIETKTDSVQAIKIPWPYPDEETNVQWYYLDYRNGQLSLDIDYNSPYSYMIKDFSSDYLDPLGNFFLSVINRFDEIVEIEINLYNIDGPINSECKDFKISSENSEESLDITLIGDRISTTDLIKVANIFDQNIKYTSPFVSYIGSIPDYYDKINIRYIATSGGNFDLGCGNSEFEMCNSAKVYDIASLCPTDEIMVLSGVQNNALKQANLIRPYGSYALVNSILIDSNYLINALLKQFAKSIAFLADENDYNEIIQDEEELNKLKTRLSFYNFPNCEMRPECDENGANCQCNKWSALTNECHQGCGFNDWYRESIEDTGIMRKGDSFSPVAERQVENAINRHINYKRDPVSYEVTKKAEDFIIQKFLEKNNKPITTEILGLEYSLPITEESLIVEPEWYGFMLNMLCFEFETEYECSNEKLSEKFPPKVELTMKDMDVFHESTDPEIPTEENTLYLKLNYRVDIKGTSIIRGDGTFGCILRKRCDEGILDVPWSSTIDPIEIYAKLKYEKGSLGELRITPTILKVTRPVNLDVAPKNNLNVNLPSNMPNTFKDRIIDLLFIGEGDPSIDFTTIDCGENQKCISSYINEELDDIGQLFRFSLDMSATGIYAEPKLGRPLGLIYDFYLDDNTPLDAVQVLRNKIRLSGESQLGNPIESRKAECIKDYEYDLELPNLDNYNPAINLDNEKHGAIKISKAFTDWHNWHMWNEGDYCAYKTIPISQGNSLRYWNSQNRIEEIQYELIPKTPPQIEFKENGEINLNGDFKLKIKVEIKDAVTGSTGIADIIRDDLVEARLVLEEPDLTLALEDGYSPAQSYFKVDPQKITLNNNELVCGNTNTIPGVSEFCSGILGGTISLEPFESDIKNNIASHYSRVFAQSPALPVRDISLNFGSTGLFFFEPGIDLNLGDYITKIDAKYIDPLTNQHIVYEFELVEKCSESEDCGEPDKAKILEIRDTYYLEGSDCSDIPNGKPFSNGCVCIKEPNEESESCINQIKTKDGVDHYLKIDYYSNDYVSNNFNLISWTPYKSEVGEVNKVYLTESINTLNKLNSGNIESLSIDDEVYRLTFDSTQVVAFRAKTKKGVEQKVSGCTAAILFDTSSAMLDYQFQPVLLKIEGNLRRDSNDLYVVCAQEDHEQEYNDLLFPDIAISSTK